MQNRHLKEQKQRPVDVLKVRNFAIRLRILLEPEKSYHQDLR